MAENRMPRTGRVYNLVAPDRVREVLSYDPGTGQFERLVRTGCHLPGPISGRRTEHGYINVTIDRQRNYAHRLAWIFMTGDWPTKHVDHINGDRADNRWANLREASHSQNLHNAGPKSDNTSGFRGVSYSKKRGKWIAIIHVDKKRHGLGYFSTKEEAAAARQLKAEELLGAFGCFSPAGPKS